MTTATTTATKPAPPPNPTASTGNASVNPSANKPATVSDVLAGMRVLSEHQGSDAEYYRQALTLLCEHCDALYGAIDVRMGASAFSDEFRREGISADLLQSLVDSLLLESQAEDRSVARAYASNDGGPGVAVLSAPLHHFQRGDLIGGIAIAIEQESSTLVASKLTELNALAALVVAHHPQSRISQPASQDTTNKMSRAMERAARYGSVRELAFQLVNSVNTKFDCTQVAIGTTRRQKMQLLAISGMDKFAKGSPGVNRIQQAMEECYDAKTTILFQQSGEYGDGRGNTGYLLHKQWHQQTGGNALLSIPLTIEDDIIAVISLQRDGRKPFSVSDVETVQSMLQPFSPAIAMLQNRGGPRMTGKAVAGFKTSIWANGVRRACFFLALAAAGIWFAFGKINYHVAVPCAVAPARIHHVVAPYEATVAQHEVETGDHVTAGQLLLKLDTTDLELERSRILSEIAARRIEVNHAIAERRRGAAALAQADIDILGVQLDLLDRKLARAEIRAPVTGLIIEGELSERIGQVIPQGDPLLEIGDDEGQFVELRIPEEVAIHFEQGHHGSFSPKAKPGLSLDCEIRRIMPSARVEGDKNVLLAEAELAETDIEEATEWMRVGMEGVAKIDVGERPVWWVALHRVIDKIRLYLWT